MTDLELHGIEETGKERGLAMQWGQYLTDEFGIDGSFKCLAFYNDIGWISNEARSEMEKLLSSPVSEQHTEYDEPATDWPPLNSLDETEYEEHAISIAFIVKISDANRHDLRGEGNLL